MCPQPSAFTGHPAAEKILPPQREILNILCDVHVKWSIRKAFLPSPSGFGMARMFRKPGRASARRHRFGPMKSTDPSFVTGRQATFIRSFGRKSNNNQLKSLILAQIERWRHS